MVVAGRDGDRVGAAVCLLVSADLATCGHRELDVLAGAVQAVRGFASGFEVRLARRRDELIAAALAATPAEPASGPAADPSGPSTVDGAPLELDGFAGGRDLRPGREVERDRRRAAVCSVVPMFETALAAGRIDVAHLDAVANAWAVLTTDDERDAFTAVGEMLVGYANVESSERFARRVRDLVRRLTREAGQRLADRQRAAQQVRRWIDATGMGQLRAELDPETTAVVWAALDAHLATLKARDPNAEVTLQRLEIDALVELLTTSRALHPRVPELSVHIDWTTLRTGVFGPGSICETRDGQPLTPETVRRLACEANIIPIVLGGDGVPLDVGRARRLATRDQRRALAAMYATCALPGCTVRVEGCRIHHIDPWIPDGETNLDRLIPVCERDHHLVHEGGYFLTMTSDRVITLRAPDGTIRYHGDTRDRTPADLIDTIDTDVHELVDDDTADEHPSTRDVAAIANAQSAAITRRCDTASGPTAIATLLASEPRRGP